MLQHVAVLKCSAPPLQLANLLKFPMAFMAARVLTFEIALEKTMKHGISHHWNQHCEMDKGTHSQGQA